MIQALVTDFLWLLTITAGLFLLWILITVLSALLVVPGKEYEKNSPYYRFLLNSATAFTVRLLGIRIQLRGAEKLPAQGRFLLVGNHRSNFDPILTWYALKDKDLAFISKPENFRIPLFGRIIQKCCFLPIDREDPRNAIRTINKAANLLKKDQVSIGVYPEGKRSRDCVLLPFHNGVFKIAQKAQVPIVVVAISGTENIHQNFFRRKSLVTLSIVDVMEPDYIQENRTSVIAERVRKCLSMSLKETKGAE